METYFHYIGGGKKNLHNENIILLTKYTNHIFVVYFLAPHTLQQEYLFIAQCTISLEGYFWIFIKSHLSR